MNELESLEATAKDLIDFAKQQGEDLSPRCHHDAFFGEGRYIMLWRKEGKVLYNMQGKINILPDRMKASIGAFRGMWHETGSLESIEQAFAFVKAWLLDRTEVDDLPSRSVRSYGI